MAKRIPYHHAVSGVSMEAGTRGTAEELRAAFTSRLRADAPPAGDLDARLGALLDEARAAWPGVALDPAVFVAHLAERLPEGEDVAPALDQVNAADLYLACACAHGVDGAIEALDQACFPAVAAAARRVDSSPAFIDDVCQKVRHKLFVGQGEAGPKIASYTGAGALRGWLGVMALRIAYREIPRRPPGDVARDAHPPELDPETLYLMVLYKIEFEEASQAAITALSDRDRFLLRLSVAENMSHEDIAAVYKVHQSTVTRWIARARESLAADTQRRLRERLRISDSQLRSVARLVVSQLDVSIVRLLREAPGDRGAEPSPPR